MISFSQCTVCFKQCFTSKRADKISLVETTQAVALTNDAAQCIDLRGHYRYVVPNLVTW